MNNRTWLVVLLFIVVLALSLALSRWRFDAVMGADIPDWLKYFLLK